MSFLSFTYFIFFLLFTMNVLFACVLDLTVTLCMSAFLDCFEMIFFF